MFAKAVARISAIRDIAERDRDAALRDVAALTEKLNAEYLVQMDVVIARDSANAELGALRERLEGLAAHFWACSQEKRKDAAEANTPASEAWFRAKTEAFGDAAEVCERALARLDASPQAAPPGDTMPPTGLEPLGCPTPGACSCPTATPVQGAPPAPRMWFPGMENLPKPPLGPMRYVQAAPADGPTCAAWCGTRWDSHQHEAVDYPAREIFQDNPPRVHDTRCYCAPACRSASRPLRPAPAVPEPVREEILAPNPATPAAEEKKTCTCPPFMVDNDHRYPCPVNACVGSRWDGTIGREPDRCIYRKTHEGSCRYLATPKSGTEPSR